MKVIPIFLLLTSVFSFAYCQGQEEALFKQIATQDSGFLQKNDALYLLSISNVIDTTTEDYEENEKYNEEHIKENDTIAKYYKMANGNYICLMEYYIGYYNNSNILIEFSPQGKILKKEIYSERCCGWSIPLRDFNKFGNFFGLEICGCAMGGYYYTNLYLFKELVPADSLNMIPLGCYEAETGDYDTNDRTISWTCNGRIKRLENDSLIITYLPERLFWGYGKEGKFQIVKIIEKEPFDVLYIYKNNQWRIANKEDILEKWKTTCFNEIDFYLEF